MFPEVYIFLDIYKRSIVIHLEWTHLSDVFSFCISILFRSGSRVSVEAAAAPPAPLLTKAARSKPHFDITNENFENWTVVIISKYNFKNLLYPSGRRRFRMDAQRKNHALYYKWVLLFGLYIRIFLPNVKLWWLCISNNVIII